MAAAPCCVRNPGQSGFGSRDAGSKGEAGHLRENPESRGRDRDLPWSGDDGIGDLDSPAAAPPFHRSPLLSGPRYSSDLRHMRMTRSVDSVQFLPFLTTDIK